MPANAFLDALAKHIAAHKLGKPAPVAAEMDRFYCILASIAQQNESNVQAILPLLTHLLNLTLPDGCRNGAIDYASMRSAPIPPELIAQALADTNEEELRAGIEEIRTTGGLQLKDFIHELEAIVRGDS